VSADSLTSWQDDISDRPCSEPSFLSGQASTALGSSVEELPSSLAQLESELSGGGKSKTFHPSAMLHCHKTQKLQDHCEERGGFINDYLSADCEKGRE
jgi:hypothetical protein